MGIVHIIVHTINFNYNQFIPMNLRMNGFSLRTQFQLLHVHYFMKNCNNFQNKNITVN